MNETTNSILSAKNKTSTNKVETVSSLILQLDGSKDVDTVAKQLVAFGKPSVPELIKLLKTGSRTERSNAAYVLARMKTPPMEAIPVIEKILDEDGTDRMHVALELQKLNPDSVKAVNILSEELRKGTASDRIIIARVLSLSPSEKFVPVLMEMSKDADGDVCLAALQTLGEIASINSSAGAGMIPAMVKALENPSTFVRRQAARNLGIIGPTASSAVPALEKMTGTEDSKVRDAVLNALHRINAIKQSGKSAGKTSLQDLLLK